MCNTECSARDHLWLLSTQGAAVQCTACGTPELDAGDSGLCASCRGRRARGQLHVDAVTVGAVYDTTSGSAV